MLNVEIKGIDFNNKGALLMLESLIYEFKIRGVDANFYTLITKDAKLRKYYPVGFCLPKYLGKFNVGFVDKFVPKAIAKAVNMIKVSDIDLVVDCSGFGYSDSWGANKAANRLGTKSHSYPKKTKFVMMPQAFGPFKDEKLVSEMNYILDRVDLAFARDKQSFDFLKGVSSDNVERKVSISPDFSQSLKSKFNGSKYVFDRKEKSVFVVPNNKLVEKGIVDRTSYVSWFVDYVKYATDKGYSVTIVNHEGQEDGKLCVDIASSFENVDIITSLDPLELKAIINTFDFGVVSRFHAAVSALCQAIPVGIIGWSHKYHELASDYKVAELITTVDSCAKESFDKTEMINSTRKGDLVASRDINVMMNEKMWDKIFNLIVKS